MVPAHDLLSKTKKFGPIFFFLQLKHYITVQYFFVLMSLGIQSALYIRRNSSFSRNIISITIATLWELQGKWQLQRGLLSQQEHFFNNDKKADAALEVRDHWINRQSNKVIHRSFSYVEYHFDLHCEMCPHVYQFVYFNYNYYLFYYINKVYIKWNKVHMYFICKVIIKTICTSSQKLYT